jgi:DNA-binding beta-propeller fold protein YncE
MIYVADWGAAPGGYGAVTVIDGATDSTTTVNAGPNPYAIAVNSMTDRIYVANQYGDNLTVIAGATDSTATVSVGPAVEAVAVNAATNQIYVANSDSGGSVTFINGAPSAIRFMPPRFSTSVLGYRGVLAVYSLNGRQVLKIPFAASETREAALRSADKIPARGFYRYRFLNDRKVMDEGNFIVK